MKRLRLVPEDTNIDFFKHAKATFGASCVAIVLALAVWFTMGLNYGIDFRGGTTLRTQSDAAVDVAAYRTALDPLELGDISISEVFDPTSDGTKHVAMVRIQAQEGEEAATPEMIASVQEALTTVAPNIIFTSVESVGPKATMTGEVELRKGSLTLHAGYAQYDRGNSTVVLRDNVVLRQPGVRAHG